MSGIEWARWTSSIPNGPRWTFSPGGSSCSGAESPSLCSSSLERTMPIVSRPP